MSGILAPTLPFSVKSPKVRIFVNNTSKLQFLETRSGA